MKTRIAGLRWRRLFIPLLAPVRHASAVRVRSAGAWVEASSTGGETGYGESCPRRYVSGESLASSERFLQRHRESLLRHVDDLDTLRSWVQRHEREIDAAPAAWCAIELALLDLFALEAGRSVESLLALPEVAGTYRYSAVIDDAEPARWSRLEDAYLGLGIKDFKLKLSGEKDLDTGRFRRLRDRLSGAGRLRADANNRWPDARAAIAHLRGLVAWCEAVEEPASVGQYGEFHRIHQALGLPIILDESLLRQAQLADLPGTPEQWIVNLRVSKMGGLLRSLIIAEDIIRRGMRLIVGAHVGETSLLTRAALSIATGFRSNLWAQEGAFGTRLLQWDVCAPSLRFGAGGLLDPAIALRPHAGFGLNICLPRHARETASARR